MFGKYQDIKRALTDILQGYSISEYADRPIYFKHFGLLDQAKIEVKYEDIYNVGLQEGLLAEADRLEQLEDQGLWNADHEMKITEAAFDLESFQMNLKLASWGSQIRDLKKSIAEQELKLNRLKAERRKIVGMTAESFAESKCNERYIFSSCFKDANLNAYFFDNDTFDYLTKMELNDLVSEYNNKISLLNQKMLQKIAFSLFFYQYFSICDNNPLIFFNKPVTQLTNFQTMLFREAMTFDKILKGGREIPNDILEDPEKVIEFLTTSSNIDKIIDKESKGEGGATMVFGATKEDIKDAGLGKMTKSLAEVAKKTGQSSFSIEDMIKNNM